MLKHIDRDGVVRCKKTRTLAAEREGAAESRYVPKPKKDVPKAGRDVWRWLRSCRKPKHLSEIVKAVLAKNKGNAATILLDLAERGLIGVLDHDYYFGKPAA